MAYADQRDHKEGQAGDYLLLQPGEKTIQPVGLLPGFADYAFIPCEDVDLFLPKQVLAKKLPEHLRPRDRRIVKALDVR